MLKRKIYDSLLEWKGREHKCLIIEGQRQVGKTTVIDSFGKEQYENYVYLNLSENTDLHDVFRDGRGADDIIKGLSVMSGKIIVPGSLIFLDDVHECPSVIGALEAFSDDGRYDVIASGSMAGIRSSLLAQVDCAEHLTMGPMDFEEFLWAKGVEDTLIEYMRRCLRKKEHMISAALTVFEDAFADFMIVGGMPEAANAFIEKKYYRAASEVLDNVLKICYGEIGRYNLGKELMKTTECFRCIPIQLDDTNKKYTYSRIFGMKGRAAHDRYAENLLWIREAGYGNFCYALDDLALPLPDHTDEKMFRIYLYDTGLLVRMFGKDLARTIYQKETEHSNGAIIENEVAECLMKSGLPVRYYRRTNGPEKMELDLVTELGTSLCVIEVDSGKRRESPSLEKASKLFNIGRRIVLGKGNISVDGDGTEHYPFFVAAFLRDIATDM